MPFSYVSKVYKPDLVNREIGLVKCETDLVNRDTDTVPLVYRVNKRNLVRIGT